MTLEQEDPLSSLQFHATSHIKYALRCLRMLPTPYQTEDCSRMSLAFFALSSLDLLGSTSVLKPEERTEYIEWIYDQQVLPSGGFRGGPFLGLAEKKAEPPHLVMSYTALLNLAILEDDLSRLDHKALLRFVQSCQMPDGSFAPYPDSNERDVRFVYCAFVICHLFEAWDSIDVQAAEQYLFQCRSYDYAFGQTPGLEAQGGTTYCAIACLSLSGRLKSLAKLDRTLDWLAHRLVPLDLSELQPDDFPDYAEADAVKAAGQARGETGTSEIYNACEAGDLQILGFQGRPEKDPDACYSFWVTASVRLILNTRAQTSKAPMPDLLSETSFLVLCQTQRMGGIAKFPGHYADLYHSYLGLAALSLAGQDGLKVLDPAINASEEAVARLERAIKQNIS